MMHPEMLSKMILGLVLMIVCHLTHSLETGYMYPSSIIVSEGTLHDDLKCTYMFSGLTHLLVTKRLTEPPYVWSSKAAIGKVYHYSPISKHQIISLYRLNIKHMGSLWLLHLYLSMANTSYDTATDKGEAGQKNLAILVSVIELLRKDLAKCRKDNSFNKEWQIVSDETPSETDLTSLMCTNHKLAEELLTKNNICEPQFLEQALTSFTMGRILLNHMGSKDVFILDLMNVFNVQVNWSNTAELLKKSSDAAKLLNWPFDWVENLKLYFELNFNFLKIIKFRLTLKHLQYLDAVTETNHYMLHTIEWYMKVKKFSNMLSLSKDLDIKGLLGHLQKLVVQEETIDEVVVYLNETLDTLCRPLGCVATNKFVLDGKEFKTPYKSSIKNSELQFAQSSEPIEYYSLDNTSAFLHYLSWVFKFSDFKLVQLLIENIKEVRVEPW